MLFKQADRLESGLEGLRGFLTLPQQSSSKVGVPRLRPVLGQSLLLRQRKADEATSSARTGGRPAPQRPPGAT